MNSPDPEVVREVVAWLESATAAPDAKLAFAAHAALLRLATAGLKPWQRAGELHQRRPDLTFPDRISLRRESGG